MWRLIGIALSFSICHSASAGLICREKATGKLLEFQSSGRDGTCLKNWVTNNPQYGYTADQIEERQVSDAQEKALMDEADRPIREAHEAKVQKHKAFLVKLCQAVGLTGRDLQECQEELQ